MIHTERDSGVIRLSVLGAVDVIDAQGKRIETLLAQPRRLALLLMLAIESMHGACPRERLIAAFWPEHSPEQASMNLRQALAFLRRVLGADVVLRHGRHALGIDWTTLQCDAVDRLHALAAGDEGSASDLQGELLAGVNLSGMDDAWEEWLTEQRRRLAHRDAPGAAPRESPMPEDPLARRAYLHGRFHWSRRPRESMKALAALREAVERAPDFAPAHAALADVYATLGSWEAGAITSAVAFPQAQAEAWRALQLDPRCAAAHASLGYSTAHYQWDWAEAERHFQHALALDPGYAHAHHWHAHLLAAQRRFDEALAASRRALELQPLDVIINVHLAWHYWIARDADACIEQSERTADLDETDHWPPFFRGLACAMCGRTHEAVDAFRDACRLSNGNAVMRAGLGFAYAAARDTRLARAVLREFEIAASEQHRYAYESAVILTTLGEMDAAFARLEDAVATRSGWIAYLGVDPRLDPLRADSRYMQLERQLGMAPEMLHAP
jgi:tetratricopeptide (TPR) repeat protein